MLYSKKVQLAKVEKEAKEALNLDASIELTDVFHSLHFIGRS